jgi:SAM-dependent methyltransferase
MSFYDELADEYDELTGVTGRSASVETFADALTRQGSFDSLLDVACGTGRFARAFAARGIRVVGADLSAGMLQQARRMAESEDLPARWVEADMQQLQSLPDQSFGAAICMGNSVPHLLDRNALIQFLKGLYAVLDKQALAVLHLLNYEKIVQKQQRFVGASRGENLSFVRFYDFLDAGQLRFNILRINWDESPSGQLHSTILHAWRGGELVEALGEAGFAKVSCHGDLALGPYDPADSDVLVLLAEK